MKTGFGSSLTVTDLTFFYVSSVLCSVLSAPLFFELLQHLAHLTQKAL